MRKFLPVLAFLLVLLPHVLYAATVTFDPQEKTVGTNEPFLVGINLDAVTPVNVLALNLLFSTNLKPVDVSNGNSVIVNWIDKPVYDEAKHALTFSGMIPGGYAGVGGRVLTVSVQAVGDGDGWIAMDPSMSHAYMNDSRATDDALTGRSLHVRITHTKSNLDNLVPDTTPPETFEPQVVRIPSEIGEQAMLAYTVVDKGSGVDHVQVIESNPIFPWIRTVSENADSPYLLRNQELTSRVTVNAYDKRGNVRTEIVQPTNPPIGTYTTIGGLICILVVLLLMSFVRARKRS